MTNYELLLPAMGEGIIEATITRWLVSTGQQVKIDQPIVEVATDKVDSEIPSPVEGRVTRLVYREGEIPRVGEVIALIEINEEGTEKYTGSFDPESVSNKSSLAAIAAKRSVISRTQQSDDVRPYISPLVRMLAKQRGLSIEELYEIQGTGSEGRITRDDLNRYFADGREFYRSHGRVGREKAPDSPVVHSHTDVSAAPEDEIVEMDRMRKIIASHMVTSKRVAPHVTSFLEADITMLVAWREKYKDAFLKKENARLTYTPVFLEIVAQALKEFPRINVAASGDSIIIRKNINIGVATALSDGNLIVPVIRNADHGNLGYLARKVADLANRARNGNLMPEEIKGGTFTITNIGQYNNLTGTPIINQPESAILAFGTIIKKPWAVKTPEGYGIAVRDIIMLSLTYDHRVIDGALGGSFLSRVANLLENCNPNREV